MGGRGRTCGEHPWERPSTCNFVMTYYNHVMRWWQGSLGHFGAHRAENAKSGGDMGETSPTTPEGVPERLIRATVGLLAEQGPSAIKARTVASAAGLSTMVVYHHFGGIPELVRAVADHGFTELGTAFSQVPVTEDPVVDLFVLALTCR